MWRTLAGSGTSYFSPLKGGGAMSDAPFVSVRAVLLALAFALGAALAGGPAAAGAQTAHKVLHVGPRTVYLTRHGDTFPGGAPVRAGVARARAAHVSEPGDLAQTWCGKERSTDDVEDGLLPGLAQIKVIYARPSDVPDHLLSGATGSRLADLIQQDVRTDTGLVASASGGEKTIRFDLGTSCGIAFVDITSIVLPRSAAEYGSDANIATDRVEADLSSFRQTFGAACVAPGEARCPRNFAIYLDGVDEGGVKGIGDRYQDDRPGPSNDSNLGGLSALIFDPLGNDYRTVSLIHETSHTLGAVQDGTGPFPGQHEPHASGDGHCWDERDVMCYDDGGPLTLAAGGVQTLCPSAVELYDCNGDDYFSTAPAPGSYLSAHWNLANSVFMCLLPACAVAARNTAPHASFSVVHAASGGLVLDGSFSGDEESDITYAWDLDGDGRIDARTAQVRRKLPKLPARYRFRLTVRDAGGLTASVTHALVVGHPPSVATALARALKAEGKRLGVVKLRGLRAHPSVRLRYTAAEPGRLAYVVRSGRRVVASATRALTRAGIATLRVVVRRSARSLLTHRTLRLTLTVAFRPRGGKATRRTRAVSLR